MNLENDDQSPVDPVDEALDLLDDMDADAVADEPIEDEDAPRKTDDLADDGELDDEPDEGKPSDGDDDAPKGGSRAQKRIAQLTREKNDARREAEYARQQSQELQREYDRLYRYAQQVRATPEQVQAGQQHGLTADQTQELIRQQATQQVEAERFDQIVVGVRQKLETGGAAEAVKRLSNPALTKFESEAMIALHEAKYPVQVARAIAENEAVFEKFAALKSGVERARFIDRLDGRLESRASGKPSSTDVKPTPRVRGSARKPEKSPDDMSQAEYEAWAAKQGLL